MQVHGLRKGDEHPAYTPRRAWHTSPVKYASGADVRAGQTSYIRLPYVGAVTSTSRVVSVASDRLCNVAAAVTMVHDRYPDATTTPTTIIYIVTISSRQASIRSRVTPSLFEQSNGWRAFSRDNNVQNVADSSATFLIPFDPLYMSFLFEPLNICFYDVFQTEYLLATSSISAVTDETAGRMHSNFLRPITQCQKPSSIRLSILIEHRLVTEIYRHRHTKTGR